MASSALVLGREFPPAPHAATGRVALGIVLTLLTVPAALIGPVLFWLPHAITYGVDADLVTVTLDHGLWQTSKVLPRARIVEARAVELSGGQRRAGSSLPGYCAGSFVYRGIGTVWQATNCSSQAVLLVLHDPPQRVVLTPSDRDGFLDTVESGATASFRPAPVTPGPEWLVFRFFTLVLVPLVLVVPLLFFLAPGRLRYTVGDGALRVRTMFVRRTFPLAGMTARRYRPGRRLKLWGSALPGYYTGSFRLDGRTTRVFASTLQEGVLLEGECRVFVTPADPESFLATLAAHGATVSG